MEKNNCVIQTTITKFPVFSEEAKYQSILLILFDFDGFMFSEGKM
jgi:hypothetical protein